MRGEGTGSNYPVFGGSLPHPHLGEEKGTRCTLLSEISGIVTCDCPVEVITFKDIDFLDTGVCVCVCVCVFFYLLKI